MPKIDEALEVGTKVANTGTTMSIGGGAWAWMAENYQQIGATCAVLGVLLTLFGLWLSNYHQGRRRREETRQRAEHYRRIEEALSLHRDDNS